MSRLLAGWHLAVQANAMLAYVNKISYPKSLLLHTLHALGLQHSAGPFYACLIMGNYFQVVAVYALCQIATKIPARHIRVGYK